MRVVKEQVKELDIEMEALDSFIARARSEQASHHERHTDSVRSLSATVEHSFNNTSPYFKMASQRVEGLASPSKSKGPLPTVLPDILDEPSVVRSPRRGVAGRESTMSSSSSLAMIPGMLAHTTSNPFSMSLREVNPNLTTTGSMLFNPMAGGSRADLLDVTVEKKPEALFKRASSKLRSKADRRET
ncbi:hypothetical protein LCI18_002255 [Fusarium solani-melongenae]|uniref:Uncharacterized protein n=1 Tax=Fusarium solani subsp. cucurbitae TaxID=2747967 RepID=A0ACD3YQV6_FUSSC|nr:hypothetical protein LCI18_002255 [Fusarium solani-melongenae]